MAEIREMLVRALPGAELVSAQLIASGKANTNYKLLLAQGSPVLLRLYVREPEVCGKEAALAKLLQGGVPVAELLYVDCDNGFSVWEWMEGKLLEDSIDQLPGCAYDLGRVLAFIGEFQFQSAGFLDKDLAISFAFGEACDAYIWRINECLEMDLVRSRMGDELAVKTAGFVVAGKALLDPYRGARRLVHSDYKVSNLMIEGSKVCAVLDWEFAHSGSPLLDVSIFLRHRDAWPSDVPERFAQGFRDNGGFLDPDWLAASRYLDLISLLDFLSRPALGEIAATDVLRLIRTTLTT